MTEEILPVMARFCKEAFETQRKFVPDDYFLPDGMGEELGELICQKNVDAWAVYEGDQPVGGAVVRTLEGLHRELELLFIDVKQIGQGYGTLAWMELEERYPDTRVWRTVTPASVIRNMVFYVNHCGFHITEILTEDLPIPVCVFEKVMSD